MRADDPCYGDNIYAIGAALGRCLEKAAWTTQKIAAIHHEANTAKSYADAIAIYRRYITIHEADDD